MKTIYDLGVWQNSVDSETYAFPIGAKDAWGDVAYPKLRSAEWKFEGILPKGMDVTDMKPVTGNRVRCKIGGASMNTADWAIQ